MIARDTQEETRLGHVLEIPVGGCRRHCSRKSEAVTQSKAVDNRVSWSRVGVVRWVRSGNKGDQMS